jgi:hypothetical protein
MTTRADILAFLRTPRAFADSPQPGQAERWRRGLAFARQHLKAPGPTLRRAQEQAWEGTAYRRAALVLGPPGTGKTFLLAWMAAGYLHACREAGRPCRVLLTGFTRESIGNLFDDLAPILTAHLPSVPMCFLGNPPGQPLPGRVGSVPLGKDNLPAARHLLAADTLVVGATGWSLYKLFAGGAGPEGAGPTARAFDLVLIDEASQMMLAQGLLCLSGLAEGGRTLVAGDDRQLPPVRPTYDAATADGRLLGGSLYAFLKSGQVSEFRLNETFRLNAPLAGPPSAQFYEGDYFSAVAGRRLALRPGWDAGLAAWERTALDPEYPVCILLHDGPPCSTDNPFERTILRRLVHLLADRLPPPGGQVQLDAATLWGERLAVVTPHRAQNAALREELRTLLLGEQATVETVDGIQGRERDAILAGYTVSDPEFGLAEAKFLYSAERLNVTVTRARSKLVLLVSRRLLEVVPPDEEVFDAAGQLREYVFESDFVEEVEVDGPGGECYPVEVRVRRFDPNLPLPQLQPQEAPVPPALTPQQQRLLDAVREAASNLYGTATPSQVREKLGRWPSYEELRGLAEQGKLQALQRTNSQTGRPFLVWRPRESDLVPLQADLETARAHIEEVTGAARGDYPRAFYDSVRDHFLWFDENGTDLFEPLARQLERAGLCQFERRTDRNNKERLYFDLTDQFESQGSDPPLEEPGDLTDSDFEVLNALEDEEARQINFGAYETAVPAAWLAARLGRPLDEVRRALGQLLKHHYLIHVGDRRARSRMAELARLVRYLKQRFGPEDADKRPLLVRSIQVRVVDRRKPKRDQEIRPALERLKARLAAVPHAAAVLDQVEATLGQAWAVDGEPVTMAAFQLRALEHLLPAYLGQGEADSFVITADTGSGKTEAACLPLMAGAAIDRLRGRRGVKALLVYPRIRLAYNQAQRLTRYLAMLAGRPGVPLLTIGLQTRDVPRVFNQNYLRKAELEELWPWHADAGGYGFPFFDCPQCGHGLTLRGGQGREGVDRLCCANCNWAFDGWVGSKEGLVARPPDFFLPVTESLHQWLHDPKYGPLFGDMPSFVPPRALLADEIHLYAHIHGAQVGYALRRVLARAGLNSGTGGPPPLAVGMSATLGDPAVVWGQLAGRDGVREIKVDNAAGERDVNPRGREYFYFVQPEVESRGQAIAGESTTIQALMCLAHAMRRRSGDCGGYRGLVFFDSIDSLKRLLDDYRDAEQGQGLARLRTRRYPRDPLTRQPRTRCCGRPDECDLFRAGECWYFAAAGSGGEPPPANDTYQAAAGPDGRATRYRPGQPLHVMPLPVYSGTSGRVEQMIARSDLVFATSSLEVGFDDSEMILVYQHYAPVNLASFIQRKGRGGRGSDDRPVTGVTLSIYSPRDAWYFRHPDAMLADTGFEVPLNPENLFVRRGQALAALLDGLARHCRSTGQELPAPSQDNLARMRLLLTQARENVDALLRRALGADVYAGLNVGDVLGLWDAAAAASARMLQADSWRDLFPWVAQRLFDAINLPLLAVAYPPEGKDSGRRTEDISLVFGQCAPGNATRRFGGRQVHWLPPPTEPFAPMLPEDGYVGCSYHDLLTDQQRAAAGNRPENLDRLLREQLPEEVGERLPPGQLLHHQMCRPGTLGLKTLGALEGGEWRPGWFWDLQARRLLEADPENPPSGLVGVHHKSRAVLLGFPLIQVTPGLEKSRPIQGLGRVARELYSFTGGPRGQGDTGLRVARAFWGVEVRLQFDDEDSDEEVWTVAFSDRQHEQPQLYGYHIQTEGVRLTPDKARLDEFVGQEEAALTKEGPRSRWLHGQLFRYLLMTRFAAAGLSGYAAAPVADLLVAANADPQDLRQRLLSQRQKFDPDGFAQVIRDAQVRFLCRHPLLTPERVRQYAEVVRDPRFNLIFQHSLEDLNDAGRFRGYLRSLVLYGLALSLHDQFVIHGRGDERQVLLHARLPLQFGPRADDTLSVFEGGDHGDGTTRTFLKHLDEAFAAWKRGELADCPYAAEDALLQLLFEQEARHPAWRRLDPNDPATLGRIGRELTGTAAVSETHLQALRRVLFQSEYVGADRFDLYDLHREVRAVGRTLRAAMGRDPSAWELVSAAVQAASQGRADVLGLSRLLAAYGRLGVQRGAPDAEGRLADQVYRLSASLCVDGCRACLHRASSLMSDAQTAVAVSRDLLQRYREFVLQPLTIRIEGDGEPPERAEVDRLVHEQGACRLLVAPRRYDEVALRLQQIGFEAGVFDPLLERVVSHH